MRIGSQRLLSRAIRWRLDGMGLCRRPEKPRPNVNARNINRHDLVGLGRRVLHELQVFPIRVIGFPYFLRLPF
jgi:hypothetical protein